MSFKDKLNLLMDTQSMTNSRLAKALSVDTSLISRWRTGARIPSKNSTHIRSIALYFAQHAKMDYQKTALFEVMGLPYDKLHEQTALLDELMFNWLSEENSSSSSFINGFIDRLDMFGASEACTARADFQEYFPSGSPLSAEVFWGIKGKREGVIRFLATVAASEKPCTLLLYSDESMEWLTEDKAFYMKWGALLAQVIAKGNKIKIIHTVNRDLSEMLEAIDRWLPLYMTGAIEPYYYPKYREHIFKRTMFIAPGIAALTSTTLSEQTNNAEHLFSVDRSILQSLVDEFNTYLSICRPLMRIFNGNNLNKLSELLSEFEEQPGECICLSNSPTTITMPEELYKRFLDISKVDEQTKERMLTLHSERLKVFESYIKYNKYTEIIALYSIDDICSNKLPGKYFDFSNSSEHFYTLEDYSEHIKNMISLLEKYKNFNLYISSQSISQNIYLSAKEEAGVILAKKDMPQIVFAFEQQNMTAAFSNYLENMARIIPREQRNQREVIRKLRELVDRIDTYIY